MKVHINEINNQDLRKKKYSIDILEKNIDNLSISTLLHSQILTPDFCIKYILNEEYASCVEEKYIDDLDVLYYQPHIKPKDLYNARLNFMHDLL